jgi:hypothetical protein
LILVDANLLLYACLREAPEHDAARDWLDARLNDVPRVGLPWPSLLAFVRLIANPRAVARPQPVRDAWRIVERWLDCDPVWIPLPTDRHRQVLAELLLRSGGSANAVPDAHLAALAMEHGLMLCTADRGFARYPGLRWENPLPGR